MAEYIEKETAIAIIIGEPPDAHYPHWYANKIKAIPAADVAPVRHGRWVTQDETRTKFMCSLCESKTTEGMRSSAQTAARRWIWSDNEYEY